LTCSFNSWISFGRNPYLGRISARVLPLEIVSLCSREAGAGLVTAGAEAAGVPLTSGAAPGRGMIRMNRAAITAIKGRMIRRARFLRRGILLVGDLPTRLPL
jgi:hypothetical protein